MTSISHPHGINLVHMGDSITFGQYIDPRVRWTSLIEARLAEEYSGKGIVVRLLNRGISGETTRMGLERYPADVQNLHPDVLTLQFGLNDCNCWMTDCGVPRVSEAAFRANLVEMIVRARLFGAREIILANNHRTLRRTPMVSGEPYERANGRYSEIVRDVAAQTGVTLCDVREAFDPYSDDQLERLLLPYPDQLHLSVEGNSVYADVIWPYIQRAVRTVAREKKSARGVPA